RVEGAQLLHLFEQGQAAAQLLGADLQQRGEQLRVVAAQAGGIAAVAAAAIDLGATALISADEDFAAVPGLPHARPDAAGVERLLDESGA
ncbi:MAG TPA: hypothetical protein VFG58_08825, partial [Solirubrobacterales bacterium]|nr:hypothetical protein [Solirubrobacterales bacterium]